jgi:hypothetical protein
MLQKRLGPACFACTGRPSMRACGLVPMALACGHIAGRLAALGGRRCPPPAALALGIPLRTGPAAHGRKARSRHGGRRPSLHAAQRRVDAPGGARPLLRTGRVRRVRFCARLHLSIPSLFVNYCPCPTACAHRFAGFAARSHSLCSLAHAAYTNPPSSRWAGATEVHRDRLKR